MGSTTRAAPVLQREGVVVFVLLWLELVLTGVCAWLLRSGLEWELDIALVLLFTLLERLLCLLSGLDSEPSKLRTLRIVFDLATAGL